MPTETSPAATKRINEMSVAEMRRTLIDLHATLYVNFLENGREHEDETGDAIGECFACHGIVPPMFSETNTEDVKSEIETRFEQSTQYEALGGDDIAADLTVEVFYEHEQWFVKVQTPHGDRPEVNFSVVDAAPGVHDSGIDFEEL